MEERRIMAVRDGRNPYGSRGGYVSSRRPRRSRRDRGMDYAGDYGDVTRRGRYVDYGDMGGDYEGGDMRGRDYGDYAGDMARGGGRGSRGGRGRGRGGDRGDMGDYGMYDMRGGDMARGDRGDMRGMDGHYMHGGQSMGGQTYYPIEAMGRFNGYWGMPEEDYARGGRGRDRGYDMRGGDYGDYGEGDYGDYGETLSEKELEEWNKKLLGEFEEREKQMFSKEAITQKAKQMGKKMEGFGEKELYTATLMCYSDYKQSIGTNPDLAIKLAYDWLSDKDAAVKGAEKLAVYFDCIVEGE